MYRKANSFHFFVNEFDHCVNTGLFTFTNHNQEVQTAFLHISLTLEHAMKAGYLREGGLGQVPLPGA